MEKETMRKIELIDHSHKIIYEGSHSTIKAAVEFAHQNNIPLHGIVLNNCNLRNINLDGIKIHNASFSGADLSGANMSEGDFSNCDFSHTTLTESCLCYSNFNNCNFELSMLERVDISMAGLISCSFSGFSTFEIDFEKAYVRQNLTYTHNHKIYPMNTTPTLIKSKGRHLAIIDNILIFKDNSNTLVCNSPP